ncbi:MAG: hypothetical protein QM496_12615 [Verrucomicrobiota bacterium]
MKIKFTLLAPIFAVFLTCVVTPEGLSQTKQVKQAAVDPALMALNYASIIENNRKNLTGFSWQLRIEVSKGGEMQFIDLIQGRFDASGKLQTTQINQDLKIRKRHGLISGNRQDKKLIELDTKVKLIREWILAYIYMSRGDVVNFFDRATKSPAVGYQNVIQISGKNVLRQGDAVTLLADQATGMPVSLSFRTPLSGTDTVFANIYFRQLRGNAAFYPDQVDARVKTAKEEDDLNIKVESFDFMKQM